ncbi:MAG: energy transducer TonB [Ignavibacteriales bacterium]|nr:energy transducer TonB [Ignavibacteriales bacterium]MBI3787255.1 energy transducer TonB [Ignavibacteriales bacterium]
MEPLMIQRTVDYGSTELKKVYQKYVWRALAIAGFLHIGGMLGYIGAGKLMEEDEPTVSVRILKYSELGPPPSITNANAAPAIAISQAAVKPSIGIPVPVPDAEVSPEQTIATQTELSQQAAPVSEGAGTGGGATIEKDIKIDDDAPPADFVPVEKSPEYVKQVQPKYPDLAMRAGLEGTVWVKIWVDKEGKPKKAVIIKSDAEIFNKPSIDAAMDWVFTPAMMKNGPVAVWVSIPFRYKLSGK